MPQRWGVLLLALATVFKCYVDGVAVMSVDIGSEWMKVAIVSPGVPMEIALNKESKRKTPAFIAFRDGERTIGEDAQNVGVRFPANGYGYLLELLGKNVDNPLVKLYEKRFPYHKIIPDPERGTVVFQHDSETSYTPEELIGMLLSKAKEFAEDSAGQAVNDVVLTVPGFFNQAERKALLTAAQLSGLKVLQLINDYTAVALNYGIFRRKDFNETAQYIMFYDMGASSTTATLVSYQLVKQKDKGVVDTFPQATVLGIGYDRTLGGLEIQLRIQQHLAKKFNEVKKTKLDVFQNPRALAKLFKEAGRIKMILSANTETYAQVEGLLDEEDFKTHITREELEELCPDLFDRVKGPVDQALKAAGLTLDVVSQVILVGAGTRIPKIQEILSQAVNMELGKNINTDEAAVMGAAYKAADISTGFKVKKFITKDAVIFPIQVTFDRENENGEVKHVRRTLFGPMNPYPQKKVITFNKHTDDFSFYVVHDDLGHLPPHEVEVIGNLTLNKIDVTNVKEAFAKYEGPNAEAKGIKAHFSLDESGILSLVNIELVVEKNVTAEEESETTFQKIGSSFSKLFGGSEDTTSEEEKPTNEVPEEAAPESGENIDKDNTDKKEKEELKDKTEPPKEEKIDNEIKNTTEKETKPKIVIVKEQLPTSSEKFGLADISDEQLQASIKKLQALDEYDRQKNRRESAQNALESYVFEAQRKLGLKEYQKAATAEEKESITTACQQMATWLEDEGYDADAQSFEDRLTQLKSLTGPLYRRVKEHEERPEALATLDSVLNGSSGFLEKVKDNFLQATGKGEESMFTEVEVQTLEKVIEETKDWKVKAIEEQSKTSLSSTPKLTIQAVREKIVLLEREVKYLLNKMKIWKPKTPPKTDEIKQNKTETGGTEKTDKTGSKEQPKDGETVASETVTNAAEEVDANKENKSTTEDEHVEL